MSTRPTEPGSYRWRASGGAPWEPVYVQRKHIRSVELIFLRPGLEDNYPLEYGEFGPRIPDPTEPGEILAGGLTADEANTLYRLAVAHSMDTAVSSHRGRPDDPTLESVLSGYLDEIGFTRMTKDRPEIVCLCGSSRFFQAYRAANYRLTMAGKIVLSIGFFPSPDAKAHGEHVGCTPEQKVALDVLHCRKIDLADTVYVLDIGGYVGDSTRREIAHATATRKPIAYASADAEFLAFLDSLPGPDAGLTDPEIIAGSIAYDETYTAFDPTPFPMRDWNRLARQSGAAAFRRAVAETRESAK